jgi:hypothetical protein
MPGLIRPVPLTQQTRSTIRIATVSLTKLLSFSSKWLVLDGKADSSHCRIVLVRSPYPDTEIELSVAKHHPNEVRVIGSRRLDHLVRFNVLRPDLDVAPTIPARRYLFSHCAD